MPLLNPARDALFPAKTVAFSATAGTTSSWPSGADAVLIWCDSAAYVLVGEGVTATTTNGTPIPANTPIPFLVPRGTGAAWVVSAIQVSSSGNLYAKPIASQ